MVETKDIHWLFWTGLFIFIAPLFGGFVNINLPQWISGVGIVTIVVGAILTGIKK